MLALAMTVTRPISTMLLIKDAPLSHTLDAEATPIATTAKSNARDSAAASDNRTFAVCLWMLALVMHILSSITTTSELEDAPRLATVVAKGTEIGSVRLKSANLSV